MTLFQPKSEDLSHLKNIGESPDVDSNVENLPIPTDLPEHSCEITRTEILDFGNEGYLLNSVISSEECLHYIEEGEKLGFKLIHGANNSYRNSKRIIFKSEELAALIWPRILPFLHDIEINDDPHKVHIHGIKTLLEGNWKPLGLNNLFRLCKYNPGGHFAPHFDGHIVHSSDVRSLKTFMLYLNGDFEDGTTNFVDESQELYMDEDGKYCAEAKNVLCRLQPEPGLAIIFNHHRLHEGEAVKNGVKYILRTDILYQKSDGRTLDPKEEEALKIAQEAERLECSGDEMKAMELYRKAFKMSPALAASYGS